jgi:hypothetical protein
VPENPIRRLIIGSELLNKIKAGMADPDMEYMPTDYVNGCDFRIRKTRKGDYNNYGTSEWARRTRPLTEAEQLALEQYGLFNLADFLGPRPSKEEVEGIRAMFHASLAGEAYDMETFGKFPWKPYGSGSSSGGNAVNTVNTFTSHENDELDDFTSTPSYGTGTASSVRSESVAPAAGKVLPQDIMDQLRAKAASRS